MHPALSVLRWIAVIPFTGFTFLIIHIFLGQVFNFYAATDTTGVMWNLLMFLLATPVAAWAATHAGAAMAPAGHRYVAAVLFFLSIAGFALSSLMLWVSLTWAERGLPLPVAAGSWFACEQVYAAYLKQSADDKIRAQEHRKQSYLASLN